MCGADRLLEWVGSEIQKKTHKILTLIPLWGSALFFQDMSLALRPFQMNCEDLSAREKYFIIPFGLSSVHWNPPLPGNSWWLLKPVVPAMTAFEPWNYSLSMPAPCIPVSIIHQLLVSGIEEGSQCGRQQAPGHIDGSLVHERRGDHSQQHRNQECAPWKWREHLLDRALGPAPSDRIPRAATGAVPWAPM